MIHRGLLFWSVAAIATACGLFTVKYKVQDLEEKIDRTNQKIIESQQATHILRVEWAHLNEAERTERLALKYLKVEPATIKQVVRLDSLQTADSKMAASKAADAKTADSQPPRRDPPLPSPPRTGNDVPSSTLPGGGRVAAEAGSPPPASAPSPGRSTGPTTPPRPAINKEPATSGPVGDNQTAAASIDEILSRNDGGRR